MLRLPAVLFAGVPVSVLLPVELAGEILDVDGRVGGFNFQWAWASGQLAGTAAAKAGTSKV